MKRVTKKHVEVVVRSIQAKTLALDSKHIPIDVRRQIAKDIELMTEIRHFLYHYIDNRQLF